MGHYPRPCHRTPSGLAVLDHPYRPPRLVWRRSWHLFQSEALLDIKGTFGPPPLFQHSFQSPFSPLPLVHGYRASGLGGLYFPLSILS
jgi:hypothetical protein